MITFRGYVIERGWTTLADPFNLTLNLCTITESMTLITLQQDVMMTKVLQKTILIKVTLEFLLSIFPTIKHQNLRTSHSNSTLFTN